MSFKSLAVLTLGRLKRGINKTLSMLTLGRLNIDTDQPETPFPKGSGAEFVKPGRMVLNKFNTQSNNAVIVMLESSLL